jgi:hypothetical protein
MKPQAYLIFHLNLAFSSIPEDARATVIERCYHPLLRLVESTGIPFGIELTGWTLEQIRQIDPAWVGKFKRLLHDGRVELIGSGYAQIIGPLVPYKVNQWNQRLGMQVYERELAARPKIALVNEMAFSSSMVDVYMESGYEGVVMDRDNVRLALGIEDRPIEDVPTHGVGPGGATLPVLWADSILFQRLQHYVHGDIRRADYVDYLKKRIESGDVLLPLYANDVEVIDFRPGRFSAESPMHPAGEWLRLERLLGDLTDAGMVQWCSPTEALQHVVQAPQPRLSALVSAAQPIPVKKQAKYNVSRWAVTGRSNTWLNTICHRLAKRIDSVPADQQKPEDWQTLCLFWASDLRTHITSERWQRSCEQLADFANRLGVAMDFGQSMRIDRSVANGPGALPPGFSIVRDDDNILLAIESPAIRLVLNLRRGLTINSLAFRSHDFVPIAGTLAHGYFNAIALGADFYTGGVVIELPELHSRITDLERVEPEIIRTDNGLQLRVEIPTRMGSIVKTITIDDDRESIALDFSFPGWSRPHGIIHVGSITFLPEAFAGPMSVACANGGRKKERFMMDQAFDHSAPSASMVSCTSGLGATDGQIDIGDELRGLAIEWDPAQCAALPMMIYKLSKPSPLSRLFFSLQEIDDTTRPGGALGSLTLRLSPRLAVPNDQRTTTDADNAS